MTDASNTPTTGSDPGTEPTVPLTPLAPPAPAESTEPATPAAPGPAAPGPAASGNVASAAPQPRKRRPLFPTILWGAMMLAAAAFFAARELIPGGFDLVTWLLTAVVGIGLLLVVAGIAAASRRAG